MMTQFLNAYLVGFAEDLPWWGGQSGVIVEVLVGARGGCRQAAVDADADGQEAAVAAGDWVPHEMAVSVSTERNVIHHAEDSPRNAGQNNNCSIKMFELKAFYHFF